MKQLKGTYIGNEAETMGVISHGRFLFDRKNVILVKQDLKCIPWGYKAAITNSNIENERRNLCVVPSEKLCQFHDGDVVLINNNGIITFLYEINAHHNALFVTEKCNHRCIMCPQPPVTEEDSRIESILKLIDMMDRRTEHLGITGGEPTLLGNELIYILQHIAKRLPFTYITLLTNGVRLSDYEYAESLFSSCNNEIQIDIPLFSDVPELHNDIVGANTFYKTIEGLYNLALLKQKVGIRIVIHKQTYKRLPQLAEYIYRNFPFVFQVAFMQMETIGISQDKIDQLWIDPYDYNNELKQAVTSLAMRGVNVALYNMQLCILPHSIRKYARRTISDWKMAYLPTCETCSVRMQCGGFFSTNNSHISSHLKPII